MSRVNRVTRYRLIPVTCENAAYLSGVAGASRFAWNELLRHSTRKYAEWVEAGKPEGERPSVTFFSFGKVLTELKKLPEHEWLQDFHAATLRLSSAKRLADAYAKFFKGDADFPRFKERRGDDSFTLPEGRVRDDKLFIPKLGKWLTLRRNGGDPYVEMGECRQVTVKRELGKWYAYVTWRVPAKYVERQDNGRVVGIDMNAGQVATSDGDFYRMPDVAKKVSKWHRYQRRLARQQKGSNRRNRTKRKSAKARRAIRNARDNWAHETSHDLAEAFGTVVVEDLNTKGMTKKAGRKKARLNKSILDTGWHDLYRKIEYKAANVVKVNPAYTSQTCHECGHTSRSNRRSQSQFICVSCGYESNADVNAALNIKALGTGATGRGGALVKSCHPYEGSVRFSV